MDQDFFDDYVTAWTAAGMFDATDEEASALIDRLARSIARKAGGPLPC